MKTIFALIFTLISTQVLRADISWTSAKKPVTHEFTDDETLWFVAQLYYIKGENYKKIMAANGIKDPNSVKKGTMLVIPDPVHNPHHKDLSARYKMLHEIRTEKLAGNKHKVAPTAVESENAERSVASTASTEKIKPTKIDNIKEIAEKESQIQNEKPKNLDSEGIRKFVAE